jgi:hypothetical protein
VERHAARRPRNQLPVDLPPSAQGHGQLRDNTGKKPKYWLVSRFEESGLWVLKFLKKAMR